jgi:hypothetical protein
MSTRHTVLLGLASLMVAGCTTTAPVPQDQYSRQQRVVMTFKNGDSLRGRIDVGSEVQYASSASIYQAEVSAIDDEKIVLGGTRLLTEPGGAMERERMVSARVAVTDTLPQQVVLSKSDIQAIEEIRLDVSKTSLRVGFWGYAAVVLGLLLSERP